MSQALHTTTYTVLMVQLGSGFNVPPPTMPPEPDPTTQLLVAVERLRSAIETLPGSLPAAEAPRVEVSPPDLTEIVNAVNGLKGPQFSPDDIAGAVAKALGKQDQPTTEVGVVEAIKDLVAKVDFRMQGMGRAFGSSGPSNIASDPNRRIGKVSGEGNLSGLATQTTLETLEGKDFATQVTLAAVLTELQRRKDYKTTSTTASVSGIGGFVTVHSITPTVDFTVIGFNADIASILDARFRIQLLIGGTVAVEEQLTTGMNGWLPVHADVDANTTVEVAVNHDEATDQTVRAAINWYEEP